MRRQKIEGHCVWTGEEMAGSRRWVFDLSDEELTDIDRALHHAQRLGRPWHTLEAADFPLKRLSDRIEQVRDELEDGCGMVKLRRLPVDVYGPDQLKLIYFGLGRHLGRPLFQNRHGEFMREIRDEGGSVGQRYGQVDTGDGTFLSSYARTLSNGALRFHTDRCDVVALLCVRQAGRGGVSKLASSAAVHNALLERHPDLLEVLYQPYYRSRFGEEPGGEAVAYPLPVFGQRDGKLTSHFSLTYIEAAALVSGAPKLSHEQRRALDLLLEVSEELSFEMTLEPGDIQLLNNHVIYHGRTPFEDDAARGRERLLYRLWLSMPNSRALPEDHAVLWGAVAAGAPRGGIGQSPVA